MTFEQLLTNNGEHPQRIELLYSLQQSSDFWMDSMMFFNSNHQKPIEKMTDRELVWAKEIQVLLIKKWDNPLNQLNLFSEEPCQKNPTTS